MTDAPSHSAPIAWDDADAFLGRLDQLAHEPATTRETFFAECLSGVVAHAAAEWVTAELRSEEGTERLASVGQVPADATASTESVLVRGGIGSDAELVICYRPASDRSPREIHRGRDLVEAACEVASIFLLRDRYEALRQQQSRSLDTQRRLARVEAATTLSDAARHATLFLESATGWNRVSVLRCGPWGCRVVAVSGSQQVDRRSPRVKGLERCIHAMRRGIESEKVKAQYLAAHRTRHIECQRVDDSCEMVLEHFHGEAPDWPVDDPATARVIEVLAERNTAEARRWLAFSTLPVATKGVVIAATITALCLIALMIPWTLRITASGRLLPLERKTLFAPAAGVVARTAIENGARCDVGDFLAEIESHELELLEQQLIGELATLRTELAGVQAGRIGRRETGRLSTATDDSSSEELLKTRITGLEQQLAIVEQQQADLVLHAPIAGVLHRMDDTVSLAGRPVIAGQYLCDLYKETGDWSVELDVPEDEIGYVLEAAAEDELAIEFATATAPGRWHDVAEVFTDSTARIDEQGRVVVRVRGRVSNDATLRTPRIGSGVTARVSCGRSSLLFVWTRELIQAIQKQGWF